MQTPSRTDSHPPRKQIIWGLALIVLGGLFFADRAGAIDIGPVWRYWQYWPLAVVFAGLVDLIGASGLGEAIDALLLMALGSWLYACLQGLWGWSFASTWPILLVAFGLGMIAKGMDGTSR